MSNSNKAANIMNVSEALFFGFDNSSTNTIPEKINGDKIDEEKTDGKNSTVKVEHKALDKCRKEKKEESTFEKIEVNNNNKENINPSAKEIINTQVAKRKDYINDSAITTSVSSTHVINDKNLDNVNKVKISVDEITEDELANLNNLYTPREKDLSILIGVKFNRELYLKELKDFLKKHNYKSLDKNVNITYINDTNSYMKHVNSLYSSKFITFYTKPNDISKVAIITESRKCFILDLFNVDIEKISILLESQRPIKLFYSSKEITKWCLLNNIKLKSTYDVLYAIKTMLNSLNVNFDINSIVKLFFNHELDNNDNDDINFIEKSYFIIYLRQILNEILNKFRLMSKYKFQENIIKALSISELFGVKIEDKFKYLFSNNKNIEVKDNYYYPKYEIYGLCGGINSDIKLGPDLNTYNGIFSAKNENKLIVGRFENLQMRLCIEFANIEKYIDVFIKNKDFFSFVASLIYEKEYNSITEREYDITSFTIKAIIQNYDFEAAFNIACKYLKKNYTKRELYNAYYGFANKLYDLYEWIKDTEYSMSINNKKGLVVCRGGITYTGNNNFLYTYLKLVENIIIKESLNWIWEDIETFNELNSKFNINFAGIFKNTIILETSNLKYKVAVDILNNRMLKASRKILKKVPALVNTNVSETVKFN